MTLFLTLGANGQQATQVESQQADGIVESNLGSTKNVHQRDGIFFGGQFTPEDLAKIKEQNVTRIVSLRTEGEVNWDEKAVVEAEDIEFINVPFRAPESLTDQVFDEIRDLLKDKTKPTLLHCGSASRVGCVWIPYRVLDEGVDLETALEEAETIGLRTPFIKEKAIEYIKRKQAQAIDGNEASVNPGINKSYKDPKLNVDRMVERFEMESREVYLLRKQIVEACEIKPGSWLADVGSGTGVFSRLFSASVGEDGWVYAVDIAPRLVSHVVNEASKSGMKNITGIVCAENSINLPSNSVDFVFACDTYHHFEYPKSTLASIHKALRSGGRMVVVDFDRIEGKSRDWLLNHVRAGKEAFRAEIQDAGFTFVEEKFIDGFKENYFLVFQKAE